MTLRRNSNRDEWCYPFIYETSYLCDFEVASDELCNHVGVMLALMPAGCDDMVADLHVLQPLVYHLNGSIRGRLAVDEEHLHWLRQRYQHYQRLTQGRVKGFVLPCGPQPVPQLHLGRSAAKKVIRWMVRLDQEGVEIPEVLPRFCNLLCNFFFVLALTVNMRLGVEEIPFVSESYGVKAGKEKS